MVVKVLLAELIETQIQDHLKLDNFLECLVTSTSEVLLAVSLVELCEKGLAKRDVAEGKPT
jgi:hypothetical protein